MVKLYLPKHIVRQKIGATEEVLADHLDPNEVCMGMWQGPQAGRWIQKIFVVRDDTIAKHVTDCGPATDFPHIPVEIIPGDDETTVGEFLYEAERHRHDLFAHNHLERVKARHNLKDVIPENQAKRREIIKGQSVSGPYQTTSRNNYSSRLTWRRFFDRRAEVYGKRVSTKDGMK